MRRIRGIQPGFLPGIQPGCFPGLQRGAHTGFTGAFCAFVWLSAAWAGGLMGPSQAAATAPISTGASRGGLQDDAALQARADDLIRLLESDASAAAVEPKFREAFDAFIERMDAFDGERAVRLARGMHARAQAVWSVFCLEGALRRSAGPDADSTSPAFLEADGALSELLNSGELGGQDEIDVIHRKAILAAGFGDRPLERAALGAALARRGVDGRQISGLSSLTFGDPGSAARLFGSLLDDAPGVEEAPAWALRGHGLAALELLAPSSSSDSGPSDSGQGPPVLPSGRDR